MLRPALSTAVLAAAVAALSSGCDLDEPPPGRMTDQTFQRLSTLAPNIAVDDVVNNGAIKDVTLAQVYVAGGGPPPHVGQDCYYASTHPSSQTYSGTAQFCFGPGGQLVSTNRSRPYALAHD